MSALSEEVGKMISKELLLGTFGHKNRGLGTTFAQRAAKIPRKCLKMGHWKIRRFLMLTFAPT